MGAAARPAADIRLADLHRCLRHPARWFMERRLGVFLRDKDAGALEDDEPFTLADDFASKDAWIAAALAGRSADEAFAQFKARGELPQGSFAAVDWKQRVARFAPLVQRLKYDPLAYQPQDVDLVLPDGRRLLGRLDAVASVTSGTRQGSAAPSAAQRAWTTADKPHARMIIDAWIDHLVLAVIHGGAAETRIEAADVAMVLRQPPEDPLPLLGGLVALFDSSQLQPLRFFPKSAWAYASAGKAERRMIEAAIKWNGSKFSTGKAERRSEPERSDDYFAACFAHEENPLADAEFSRLAEQVFGPVVACSAVEDDAGREDEG